METFYFDAEVGGMLLADEEGQELADRHAARREAVGALTEMARALRDGGTGEHRIAIWVRDERGQVVSKASLSLTLD